MNCFLDRGALKVKKCFKNFLASIEWKLSRKQQQKTDTQTSCILILGRDEGYTVNYNPLPEGVPKGKAEGTPEGEGVYLTIYLQLSPNTDSILFEQSSG